MKHISFCSTLLLLIGLLAACSQSSTPPGGQVVDLIPPQYTEETPANVAEAIEGIEPGMGTLSTDELDPNGFGARVIELVNNIRIENGCPPLAPNQLLTIAAHKHSQNMATADFFDHVNPAGIKFDQRVLAEGYVFAAVAENLAGGQPTPEEAVNDWMNSEGHRANILKCHLTETGVGYVFNAEDGGAIPAFHYWTQLFASPQ